jgi:fatty-acyl-CoA synthase
MSDLSHAHGTSAAPLLGDTAGRSLDRAVEAFGER